MSLRALIRTAALGLGLTLSAPLLWRGIGPWSLLAGPGLLLLAAGYLVLAAGQRRTSRWLIRYRLETQPADEQPNSARCSRLDATLCFLAEEAGRIVVEASHQGLFLEAPAAFDRYIQAQLALALPEGKVNRAEARTARPTNQGTWYLSITQPNSSPLRWATEGQDRQVRLYLQRGPRATLVARSLNGDRPPGEWLRIPAPRPLAQRLGRSLPVWDELADDERISHLLPATGDDSVYSSRSRLLRLTASGEYTNGDRHLGTSADGQPLGLDRATPLLTVGAPASFLVRQALDDLKSGRTVVVVSPQRRVLNRIQREAGTMTYWLDQENAPASAHLAMVSAAEWADPELETVIETTRRFLESLGLSFYLPAVNTLLHHLVTVLAGSARTTGHDFAFTDLYAVSQSTQALKAFLGDLASMADELDAGTRDSVRVLLSQLNQNLPYIQVTTLLSTIRTALSPLRAGALHILCRPPFLNVAQALGSNSLFLVPTSSADFPEHDRFLAALLDFVLRRVLDTGRERVFLSLHLHDPQRAYGDGGYHWLDLARRDPRLSLLLDVQDPGDYRRIIREEGQEGELIFRCDEALASTLVADWELDYSTIELTEIPDDTALGRLPGLSGPVTLKMESEE